MQANQHAAAQGAILGGKQESFDRGIGLQQRKSQAEQLLDELESMAQRAEDAAERITTRLAPVLQPDLSNQAGTVRPPRETKAPLFELAEDHMSRIDASLRQIVSLLGRLEV